MWTEHLIMNIDRTAVRRAWQRIEFELELPPAATRHREVVFAAADIMKQGLDALEVDREATDALLAQLRQLTANQAHALQRA